MTKRSETIDWNRNFLAKTLAEQSVAVRTGATCPKCDGPSNPTIVKAWGHCMTCQNATIGR